MKTTKNRFIVTLVTLLTCIVLSSFDKNPGGDSFSIYLNEKLLIQQFVLSKEKTRTISLQQASSSDVIKIHYSHCGKMGVARNLSIKDQQNKVLKAWKFEDSEDGDKGAMKVQAIELAKIQKAAGAKTLSLIYSSEQLPEGFVLAHLNVNPDAEASIK